MKKTLLLGAALLSGASLLGAQTLQDPKPQEAPPVRGDETGQPQDKKDKKAAMISVWVLETTGKGWSATGKAREAFATVDDVETAYFDGTNVTFTFEKGVKVDEKALSAALKKEVEKRKLTFDSLSQKKVQRAAAAYVAKTPGLTWVSKCGKVREALKEELGDDALAVFIGKEIIIHLKDKTVKLDEKRLKPILEKNKIKLESFERDANYIL